MPLDTIFYTYADSVWTKTVNSVVDGIITSEVTDLPSEIAALQAMVANFQIGQAMEPNPDVADAITNYQQQITILGG